MSTLLQDNDVWVVKLTLYFKTGASSTSYYFSDRYYDEGELYSGSPQIYPLLVEPVIAQRGVGQQVAIKYSTTVRLYANTSFGSVTQKLFDKKNDYDFHNADCQLLWYPKADDAIATHSDSVNIRQTLQVSGFNVTGDILELNCDDTWYKNEEFSRLIDVDKMVAEDNRTADLKDYVNGQYGAIPFGENVIIDTFVTELVKQGGSIFGDTDLITFLGFDFESYRIKGVIYHYIQNRRVDQDARKYFTLDSPNKVAFQAYDSTSTVNAYAHRADAYKFQPANDTALSLVRCYMRSTGSFTEADGDIKVSIYLAADKGAEATFVGSPLGQASFDPKAVSDDTGDNWYYGYFDPAVVLSKNVEYLVVWEWTGSDLTTNYPSLIYDNTYTGSDTFFMNDGGSFQDATATIGGPVMFGNGLWQGYTGSPVVAAAVNRGTGDEEIFSTYAVSSEGNSSTPADAYYRDFNLKAQVYGITDDGSGTYTGSAGAVIKNPADVIRFILGITTNPSIDSSAFDTARTVFSDRGMELAFAVDTKTDVDGLIVDICTQVGCVVYKTRNGDMTIKVPATLDGLFDYTLDEARLRNDFRFIGMSGLPHDRVLNDFEITYSRNELSTKDEPALIRRSQQELFESKYKLNASNSSDDDTYYEGLCDTSVNKYGKRSVRTAFDKISGATNVRKSVKYLCERWSALPERLVYEVPMGTHNAVDLFDDVKALSFDLPDDLSAGELVRINNNSDECLVYNEGVPTYVCSEGIVEAQVVEIIENGSYLQLICETVNSFHNL